MATLLLFLCSFGMFTMACLTDKVGDQVRYQIYGWFLFILAFVLRG